MNLTEKRISQAYRMALSRKAKNDGRVVVSSSFLADLIDDYKTLELALKMASGPLALGDGTIIENLPVEFWVTEATKQRKEFAAREDQDQTELSGDNLIKRG